MWLYGSHARGQQDQVSDQDILVISDLDVGFECLHPILPVSSNETSISRYTWKEIKGMAAYGSLFLQHLRIEAAPLYESASNEGLLRSILDNLGDYTLADRDVRGFEVVLEDAEEAINENGQNNFELAVIGTVIRHSSILGCWLLKNPSFARTEPVTRFISLCGLSAEIASEFDNLYRYRLYIYGRIAAKHLQPISAMAWLLRAQLIVQAVKELVYGRA